MSRFLGIDHGTVRVGLALSDPLGLIARPLETVPEELALMRIPEVIREHGVTGVVLGLPLRLDGTEGPAAARVHAFADRLRPLLPDGCPLWLRDESFTTVEAAAHQRSHHKKSSAKPARRGAEIDPLAAAFILQEFLDERAGLAAAEPLAVDDDSAL